MGSLSVIPSVGKIIEMRKNVMMIGPHGCGKSHTIRDLSKSLGLKVAIFNCATMDPYIDFVGVPVPNKVVIDGVEIDNLRMVRKHTIDSADIIFFDEVNRAQAETLNGILEIAEERSVNGEPLTQLKSVFAAMNPPGSSDGTYNVNNLDSAFKDRFDHFFTIKPAIDTEYVASVFDAKTAEAVEKWWVEHHEGTGASYISPRRAVKAAKNYRDYGDKKMFVSSFDPDEKVDATKFWELLQRAAKGKPLSADSVVDAGLSKKSTRDKPPYTVKFEASPTPTTAPVIDHAGIMKYIDETSKGIEDKGSFMKTMSELGKFGRAPVAVYGKREMEHLRKGTKVSIKLSPRAVYHLPEDLSMLKRVIELSSYQTSRRLSKMAAKQLSAYVYRVSGSSLMMDEAYDFAKYLNSRRERGKEFNLVGIHRCKDVTPTDFDGIQLQSSIDGLVYCLSSRDTEWHKIEMPAEEEPPSEDEEEPATCYDDMPF